MHFSKERGKPHLSAKGNLILSHNARLVTSTSSSAGPREVDDANYIMCKGLTFRGKVTASIKALNWIWGGKL